MKMYEIHHEMAWNGMKNGRAPGLPDFIVHLLYQFVRYCCILLYTVYMLPKKLS